MVTGELGMVTGELGVLNKNVMAEKIIAEALSGPNDTEEISDLSSYKYYEGDGCLKVIVDSQG